jgi:putative membrane protein
MKFPDKLMLTAAFIAAVPCIQAQSNAFSDEDKSFLKESAQDNMAEVKLAQLALRTSKDPTATTFAKKMIADHQELLTEAKLVAMKASVTCPDSPSVGDNAEYVKLKALSGDVFDKRYIRNMVDDHHKDLEQTETNIRGRK